MTLVDAIYAQLLEQTSGEARVYARLDFYIQLAEQLLRHGKIKTAREQLRHIFGWLGDSVKLAPALAQPTDLRTAALARREPVLAADDEWKEF